MMGNKRMFTCPHRTLGEASTTSSCVESSRSAGKLSSRSLRLSDESIDQVLSDVGAPLSFRGDSSTRAGFGSLVDALSVILPMYVRRMSFRLRSQKVDGQGEAIEKQ